MSAAIQIAQMASADPIPPSRRLSSAVSAERERLTRELERRRARTRTLALELVQEEEAASALAARIRLLDELTGGVSQAEPDVRPQPRVAVPTRGVLRGARIRQVAVELLAASEWRDQPVQYADWFRLVESAGYAIAGRDPQAAFLTQITRSPVVRRFDRPGTYQLDHKALDVLKEEAAGLRDELAQLPAVDIAGSTDQSRELRDQRGRLTAALARVEARVEEAQAGVAAAARPERRAS
jgi:hypothetical protein